MKKQLFFIALLSRALFAKPLIEAKAGYFFFSSSRMNEIYDKGGIDLQASANIPLYSVLHLYTSVEYLKRSGQSLGARENTYFTAIPLSFGLRPIFPLTPRLQYYFSLGPRYTFAEVHNDSEYVPRSMHSHRWGGFANTGFYVIAGEHFTLDIFAEYSYQKLCFHSSQTATKAYCIQSGGYTIGGGLGYAF